MNKRLYRVFSRMLACFLAVILVMGSASPAFAKTKKLSDEKKDQYRPSLEYIAFLYELYYLEEIDAEKIVDKALDKATNDMELDDVIKLFVNEVGDPYSYYYTPDEYKNEVDSSLGNYCGIGATIQKDEKTGALRIVETYSKSPARKAGIKAGDLIYKVDGEDITGLTLTQIQNLVKGEKGTEVVLTTKRKKKFTDITVVRDEVTIKTVSYKSLTKDVGYIKISQFEGSTPDQFDYAIHELKTDGAKKLIIDVRNNPGGLVDSVRSIIDRIVDEDQLVTYLEDKYGNRNEIRTTDAYALDMPMVVLVDGESASASELFTGAMRDYEKATIIGTTTYGKGIAQGYLEFTNGGALKLTTAKYYTPKGECVHKKGINPDLVLEDDPNTKEDEVIELAIDMLNR